jgi:hypothetical protein
MKKLLLVIAIIAMSCSNNDDAVQLNEPTNFMVGSWKVLQIYNQGELIDVSDCANYSEGQPYFTFLFAANLDVDTFNSCTGIQNGALDNDISTYTITGDTYTVHADYDSTFRVVDLGGNKRKWIGVPGDGASYNEGDFYYIVEKQ